MKATTENIIDVADGLIRARGYQGFAFREIAQEVGIKSASVHYHFPTKGDLAQAVMNRYAERFKQALNEIDRTESDAFRRLGQYISMFRQEMRQSNTMPLCMMLGADIAVLPESVVVGLQDFYTLNLSWLSSQLEAMRTSENAPPRKQQACFVLACLHGALLGARSLNDHHYFEQVIEILDQQIQGNEELTSPLA